MKKYSHRLSHREAKRVSLSELINRMNGTLAKNDAEDILHKYYYEYIVFRNIFVQ